MDALINGARAKMGLFEALDGDKELYESLLTAMLESGTNNFNCSAVCGVYLRFSNTVLTSSYY